ncbi:glucokinase [Desulfovibrionales bacterium]
MQILAADIGGTQSRFGLFHVCDEFEPVLVQSISFSTQHVVSWKDLVTRLRASELGQAAQDADVIVLAAAGPVRAGHFCKLTNADWAIDLDEPTALPARKTILINDFVAQAMGCLTLHATTSCLCVQQGGARTEPGVRAVLGPGTGLGHCALVPGPAGRMIPLPSEGAHAPFAFTGQDETALAQFIQSRAKAPYVVGDVLVSGTGLSLLHEFLTGQQHAPADVAACIGPDSPTTAWFARFLGRAARVYALYVLALGGVFLTGGVIARNTFLVTHPDFLREFQNSSSYHAILQDIPVSLITAPHVGLYGAARFGVDYLQYIRVSTM